MPRHSKTGVQTTPPPRKKLDSRAAEMFRKVEIEVALQQELQRLNQEEKELLVYLLALDIDKIALKIDCSVSNAYRKRRHLSNKLEGLKG